MVNYFILFLNNDQNQEVGLPTHFLVAAKNFRLSFFFQNIFQMHFVWWINT